MSMSLLLLAAASGGAAIPSTPDLGTAEGRCRPNESGPAFLITLAGLKDRQGRVKVELYPPNDDDFLQDDNKLVAAGKTFRRVEMDVPKTGPVVLCVRAPAAGTYTLSLLHDRDSNRKFGLSKDGIGFPGDPKLGWSKPAWKSAAATTGNGPTRITVTMQYRVGLFSFGPLKK
ncbi:DUF2141 domain-containing protein [Sphingobium nicotianae]|uniref:DUF2141 domain-containing protein n=1 Tax=Sphingobium nicotianae TaxID=2782607 RepID=A0A9X1DDT9_9SPHN|nr:DUF2141 domain-containing protein [Sphingobium nicotianae]MBT2188061.1 DUF2141 domain-containing protein [Sphingobium nicotianae]